MKRKGLNKAYPLILLFAMLLISFQHLKAQTSSGIPTYLNTIKTAVPFLTLSPDARSSGMGNIGAASEPDVNSQHWNPAKYALIKGKGGVAINYTPWLRDLIPDINLGYLSGYYRINDKNTVSTSVRFFSLGTIAYTSLYGALLYEYQPYEWAIDGAFSRKFTDKFSGAITLRYIHSDLTGSNPMSGGQGTHPGKSVAGDLGLYYQDQSLMGERNTDWAAGLSISNMGTPVSYSADAEKTPIPTNLRLGGRLSHDINQNHTVSILTDLNKFLVPTSPAYEQDNDTGEWVLIRGKETPESVIGGMFQSFYDAPGMPKSDGTYSIAAEEFNEIQFSFGAEYWYSKLFAVRSGYHYQHASKGNQNYLTLGIGTRYRFFTFEASYLFPTNEDTRLDKTFRLSLTAEFGE